jgi:hypothetical protein
VQPVMIPNIKSRAGRNKNLFRKAESTVYYFPAKVRQVFTNAKYLGMTMLWQQIIWLKYRQ